MTYFRNCKNLEELKKEYRRLVKANHPDNGGSVEAIQKINAEYDEMLKVLENTDSTATDNNTNKYSKESNDMFKDVINNIINFDVDIEIIGTWIWVSGNTYGYKEELKKFGFKWCSNKKSWCWHEGDRYIKKSRRKMTMNDIRSLYGSEKIEKAYNNRIAG